MAKTKLERHIDELDLGSEREKMFTRESIFWWINKIREVYSDRENPRPIYRNARGMLKAISEMYRSAGRYPFLGRFYTFRYIPTTRKKLKYWDELPLVLVLEKGRTGFFGINLHMMPRKHRGYFLLHVASNLVINATEERLDFGDKAKAVDNTLQDKDKLYGVKTGYDGYEEMAATKKIHKLAYPCYRSYKYKGMRSALFEIPYTDWEVMSYLPTDYFIHCESLNNVFLDGINKTKNAKEL